jgi:hypothetical protein
MVVEVLLGRFHRFKNRPRCNYLAIRAAWLVFVFGCAGLVLAVALSWGLGTKVEDWREAAKAPRVIAKIALAMQARIVQQGVATKDEIDIETLEERLAAERTEVGSIYVRSMSFGAWARKA